ncbi:MAG: hypothetical protein JW839_09950 [Candidatus Lokiarchaeota archaeon]|nr:hypothetical protein [Candidatus Lokiarchaeota archaeon]
MAIAIASTAILIIFLIFVKKMMPHPLMMKVSSTLHACLFGYETALIELIGPRGYKTHVFPKVMEMIGKLKGEDELIDAVVNAKDSKQAMERWIEVLKLTGISKDANLTDYGDGSFMINIPHCMMCNPIHNVMGTDVKGICPMALIVGAASSFGGQGGKVVEMDYSKITPTGTSTRIAFKDSKPEN